MRPVERNPNHRVILRAARERGLHMRDAAPRARLARILLRRAPVVPGEALAHLAAAGYGEDVVRDAVLAVVGHGGGGVAGAAADLRVAGEHGDGAQLLAQRAGQRVRHRAAVAEASGEAQPLVDAEVRLDGLDHL